MTNINYHPRPRVEERPLVPKPLAMGMFALMFGTVALVALSQATGQDKIGVVAPSAVVASRDIYLTGSRDGAYVVTATDGTELAVSNAEKAGFVGVMGLVINRERDTLGVTGNPPVQVVRRENGHVAVIDPATGLDVPLIGYGADNVAAFGRLLD